MTTDLWKFQFPRNSLRILTCFFSTLLKNKSSRVNCTFFHRVPIKNKWFDLINKGTGCFWDRPLLCCGNNNPGEGYSCCVHLLVRHTHVNTWFHEWSLFRRCPHHQKPTVDEASRFERVLSSTACDGSKVAPLDLPRSGADVSFTTRLKVVRVIY